jgi:hypothetical protein
MHAVESPQSSANEDRELPPRQPVLRHGASNVSPVHSARSHRAGLVCGATEPTPPLWQESRTIAYAMIPKVHGARLADAGMVGHERALPTQLRPSVVCAPWGPDVR